MVAVLFLIFINYKFTSAQDLLPEIDTPVFLMPTENMVKEIIFPITGNDDVIGLRVYKNPKRFKVLDWYNEYAYSPGSPTNVVIDGYNGLNDGRTIYVGVADVMDEETSPVINTRIYLISRNDNASSDTINIFNQMLSNWRFNVNIEDENHKNQIKRDLNRIYDFKQAIIPNLKNYKNSSGNYPELTSGTYIQGQTNSKWISWQNVFGSLLGQTLPIDPINEFNGFCAGCPSDTDSSDYQCNNTCYNSNTFYFEHPNGSYVYQYYAPEDSACLGDYYTGAANFEYKPTDGYVTWQGEDISGNEDNIIISQLDEIGISNFSYSPPEAPVCGNNIMECGEVCDQNQNSKENAFCNQTTLCFGWACEIDWADCNGDLQEDTSNGCETHIGGSADNCDVCGNICYVPDNGTSQCIDGECSWSCNENYRGWQNTCQLDQCQSPAGEINDSNAQTCSIANGQGEQQRYCEDYYPTQPTPDWGAWGSCYATTCNNDYRGCTPGQTCLLANNDCIYCGLDHCVSPNTDIDQSQTRDCGMANGNGEQERTCLDSCPNPDWGAWGTCYVTACDYGYRIYQSYNICELDHCSDDENTWGTIGDFDTRDCTALKEHAQDADESRECIDSHPPFWQNWSCVLNECLYNPTDGYYRIYNNQCEVAHCTDAFTNPDVPANNSETQVCDLYCDLYGTQVDCGDGTQHRDCNFSIHPPAWPNWSGITCLVDNCINGYHQVGDDSCVIDIPSTPSDLSATVISSSQIELSWTDNADTETGIKIERSSDGVIWQEINTVAYDVTSYIDGSLAPNTLYHYQIKAYNNGGDSTYSNIAFETTHPLAPLAPSGLSALAVSSSQVNLSWSDNSTNETGFIIERADLIDGTWTSWVEIVALGVNENSYNNDTGLGINMTYNYKVKAYNSGGSSGYSNQSEVTTLLPAPALNFCQIDDEEIRLLWPDYGDNGQTGFILERKFNSESWLILTDSIPANEYLYNDENVMGNTGDIYHYRIKAYNINNTSEYSNEVMVNYYCFFYQEGCSSCN